MSRFQVGDEIRVQEAFASINKTKQVLNHLEIGDVFSITQILPSGNFIATRNADGDEFMILGEGIRKLTKLDKALK